MKRPKMATNTSLEERIAAVEAAIAELQKQVVIPQSTNWLQQITGSFKDEPAFEEVLAYGQVIRQGFETGAATKFDQLQSQQIQLAKMDARIAAIALFRGLILLTRNHRDFSKVSGLLIEDWTVA